MEIRLRELYEQRGPDIKEKIRKGQHVTINLKNIQALGASFVDDLTMFINLKNVEVTGLNDYTKKQLNIQSKEEFKQMSLFGEL